MLRCNRARQILYYGCQSLPVIGKYRTVSSGRRSGLVRAGCRRRDIITDRNLHVGALRVNTLELGIECSGGTMKVHTLCLLAVANDSLLRPPRPPSPLVAKTFQVLVDTQGYRRLSLTMVVYHKNLNLKNPEFFL